MSPEQARRLLHVPAGLADRLQPLELVEELVRRLRDVLDVHAVTVVVDEGDGTGAAEVARAGPAGGRVVLEVALPVTPPLRGSIRLLGPPSDRDGGRGPGGAGRLPRRHGRGDALAARPWTSAAARG